ncbi:MAG: 23S rRNA (adenine(2503)-C(2))-methyltransferase RlmN [Eubacterium sp.]|nr:23S rRNA (adenine(2503)-C(2))-methyltransferase RlmN [Eubacterium sp.]
MYMEQLTEYCKEAGWPGFRAKQIYEWLHKKHVMDADKMTNISKDMRKRLEQDMVKVQYVTHQESKQDGTRKYLLRMQDGQMIETVFMRYNHGNSVCISSQAGCAMGCSFCASTIGGCIRNLTAGEMLGQIYTVINDTGEDISNIVVMGTGEPLQNYDNLLRFIHIITSKEGYDLSIRNITVSSCGIVPNIRRLADEGLGITFALSLHAPTDKLRKTIMPIANKYSIEETLAATDYYFERTGRRITIEYSLMEGVNDSPEMAELLSRLLEGRGYHVNLIPVNPVEEREYKRSNRKNVGDFQKILEKNRINVTIRKGMGSDIDAACGQLRRKYGV